MVAIVLIGRGTQTPARVLEDLLRDCTLSKTWIVQNQKPMVDQFGLDPLSTVIRLALLPYMPPGVKLGICGNRIVFFYPTVIDWIRRTVTSLSNSGCTKHCLHCLRSPILRAMAWYGDGIRPIVQMARAGLQRLCDNYATDGNVVQTLQSFMWLIDHPEQTQAEDISDKPALEALRDSWTAQEITTVNNLLTLVQLPPADLASKTSNKTHLIACVEDFLCGKDPQLLEIIQKPAV
jgi:hypothetical protein